MTKTEREEAVRHLFIGKVGEILGFNKTIELLKQANNEVDEINKCELRGKISEVYKLINYQNVDFEWNEKLKQARKILNEIQAKL